MIGGTQKVKASITKVMSTEVKVDNTLYDTFGADDADGGGSVKKQIFSGLVEMWVLQYYQSNGKTTFMPFTNVIKISE